MYINLERDRGVYKVDQSVGDDLRRGTLWYAVLPVLSVKSELKAFQAGTNVGSIMLKAPELSHLPYNCTEDKSSEP